MLTYMYNISDKPLITANNTLPLTVEYRGNLAALPDHIKQTIQTLVGTVSIAGNDNVSK